jgi:Protein of unknown function (DUF3179)
MRISRISLFTDRRVAWIFLLVTVLVALLNVLAPVWIIQPFKPQYQGGLVVSYAMRRWAPLVTVIALAFGLFLVVKLWSGSRRWWKKALLVTVLVLLSASTWFARQNHFEWMFNPISNAAYAKTTDAAFVGDSDIVLAVATNGEAAAYPVRLMAYHHLVQDVVGGTPIVATY